LNSLEVISSIQKIGPPIVWYKVGPLPVITGFISPITRVIRTVRRVFPDWSPEKRSHCTGSASVVGKRSQKSFPNEDGGILV